VKFASQLSVNFEIWCDKQIDALVRGNQANWQQASQQIGSRLSRPL